MEKVLNERLRAKEYFIELHDVVCNQKYADYLNSPLPYSFHLEMVVKQVGKFKHLLTSKFGGLDDYEKCLIGAWGHDAIEDARVTYNDMLHKFGFDVAEIIYCCTEEKGKNRNERHSDLYFDGLKNNRLATFVKLCDIIANVKFGLLTNSSMYPKYKKEFPVMKEKIYREEFKEMFDYLETILSIN